ncbi:MAG: Rid family detoxifying hydrolase [Phycisphaerae bacterium]
MSERRAIATDAAPKAVGPYSQAIVAGDFIFCAGQGPLDPATGRLVEDDIAACVDRTMRNIAGVLAAEGATLDDIVKTTVFLADMADYPAVNEAYGKHFTGTPPARSAVQAAKLPLGMPIEIEAIAVRRVS